MKNWLKNIKGLFVAKQPEQPKIVPVSKDTELYNYVVGKMQENEAAMLRDKIEDLEKVIYSLSTKINILSDAVKKNSEYIVHLATVYEEVQNELEREYGISSDTSRTSYSDKSAIDSDSGKKQTKKTDLN